MALRKRTISVPTADGGFENEDWYFNVEEADLIDVDLIHEKNPGEYLTKLIEDGNSRELLHHWRQILFAGVGKRVDNRIEKSPEIQREFKTRGAFGAFFADLIRQDDAGANFIYEIMPDSFRQEMKPKTAEDYTRDELVAMSDEEFDRVAGTDLKKMPPAVMQVAYQRQMQKKGGADAA
jgi:hypothetical protein